MAFVNRPMQKVILNSSTKMSLHERFTYLRSQSEGVASGGSTQRQTIAAITSKNRRLAQQMERRPAVMAALKIKKRSLKQRLGQTTTSFGNIKDRLTLTRRGSLRGSGRLSQMTAGLQRRGRTRGRKPIGGGGGGGRLSRSQSMQSLNGSNAQRMRSRSRSRSRVRNIAPSGGGGGGGNLRRGSFRRGGGGGGPGANWVRERVNFRGGMRGSGGGGGRGVRRGFSTGGGNWRGRSFQGQRGRSNFRGRGMRGGGRGGRGGRGGNWRGRGGNRGGTVPTKEELDSQLDQYMASSQNTMDLS